jgi:hypothetical protein
MTAIREKASSHGSLVKARPTVIEELRRGVNPLVRIARLIGVDGRTLRTALRKGEEDTTGPWHELHLAELSSRHKRPWGCRTGPGKAPPRAGRQIELKQRKAPALKSHERAARKARPHRGRRRLLNRDLIKAIATNIRYGSSRTDMAVGLGLHPRTLPKWLARGKREPNTIYGEFYRKTMEARRDRRPPAPLTEVTRSVRGWISPRRVELHLPELELARKCTAVLFVDSRAQLIEMRWPRPKRRPKAHGQLLKEGLQVFARDSDGRSRWVIFLANPPARVRAPRRLGLKAAPVSAGTGSVEESESLAAKERCTHASSSD